MLALLPAPGTEARRRWLLVGLGLNALGALVLLGRCLVTSERGAAPLRLQEAALPAAPGTDAPVELPVLVLRREALAARSAARSAAREPSAAALGEQDVVDRPRSGR